MNSQTKTCQNCKQEFTIEPDDFVFYERIKVPPPTFCPECRQQRRMAWRNDYNFYPQVCGLCGRKVLSVYSADKPFVVYCPKCWWSDGWDAKEYGTEIEWDKPFFPQYRRLLEKVPALAILNDNDIASLNCEYTNYFALGKNCYLVLNSWKVENCMYSYCLVGAKEAVECGVLLNGGENLYSAVYADNSSRSKYVYDSASLLDCSFCFDCRGCANCFMCIGLRNKSYNFKNKQYAPEEYKKILDGYRLDSWSGVERAKKEFEEFALTHPRKFANINNSYNCTGNYLMNSKNAKSCFITVRVEDSKYFERGDTIKDSYDCLSGGEQELCYESINPDNSSRALFTSYCHKDNDVLYGDSCQSSDHLFGCAGLKKAKYCILNKQYEPEDYEKTKNKLIELMRRTGEWGEFFPAGLSPFYYNESVAQDEFPLNREQADALGLKWQENFTITRGKETLKQIPDSIKDVPDSITNEVLSCSRCGRNYKILAQELGFYRKNGIPVPRICFYCRFAELYRHRGPIKLWPRKCQCAGANSENGKHANTATHPHGSGACQNKFETTYAPGRPEIVYCEQCYQAEVV